MPRDLIVRPRRAPAPLPARLVGGAVTSVTRAVRTWWWDSPWGSWSSAVFGGTAGPAKLLTFISNWLDKYRWMLESSFLPLASSGFKGNSIVYAALTASATAVAEPKLVAKQGSGDDLTPLDPKHPLAWLIEHPNELMTQTEFWELTNLYQNVRGSAYWFKERDATGQIAALWPLRPDRVGPVYSTSMEPGERVIYGWSYLLPGTSYVVPLDRRDVMHIGLPDIAGESGGIVEGFGPLQALAAEVGADNEATRFVGAVLHNTGLTTTVIKVKSTIPNQQAAQLIKDNWAAQQGGNRRGEAAVLDADADVTQLGWTLSQLEFPAIRMNSESRILSCIGVPPEMIGTSTAKTTFNNRAEAKTYFVENVCMAFWVRYQQQYQKDIADEFGDDYVVEFALDKVRALADKRLTQIAPYQAAWQNGGITRNTYLKALGLPPDEENGEVYFVPNSGTISEDGSSPEPVAPPAPIIAAPGAIPGGGRLPAPGVVPTPNGNGKKPVPAAQKAAPLSLVAALRAKKKDDRATLTSSLHQFFAQAQADTAARIASGQPLPQQDWSDRLGAILAPHLTTTMAREITRLGQGGLAYDPADTALAAHTWSQTYVPGLIGGLTDTTAKLTNAVVSQYQATPGMTLDDVSDALEPAFGPDRADMIAVTEITRAHNQAMNAYQGKLAESGIQMERVWQTNKDDLVCEHICGPLDGLPESEWPAELQNGPPGHPRCRCSTTLRFPIAPEAEQPETAGVA